MGRLPVSRIQRGLASSRTRTTAKRPGRVVLRRIIGEGSRRVNAQPTRPTGRILAVDYGTVRLGLAISDAQQQFSSPYANYTRVSTARDLQYLRRILDAGARRRGGRRPARPFGWSRKSRSRLEARRFAAWLARETGMSVNLYDERFTSVEAESHLRAANLSRKRRKARRDMLAAQLLLAAYLESDREADHVAPQGLDDSRRGGPRRLRPKVERHARLACRRR